MQKHNKSKKEFIKCFEAHVEDYIKNHGNEKN